MNVAFCIFNRPNVTARVFARIAGARPERLLLVADGPRADRPDDAAKVARVREIVAQVTWPCEVHRNFAPANLGCRQRMSSGLDWVFSVVDEAIILEDDCLPDPSFFAYCQALLDRYRADPRVMHIGGSNFLQGKLPFADSYHFTKFSHIWGWATWRRAWQHYDVAMRAWPAFRDGGLLAAHCPDPREAAYYRQLFDRMHAGEIDTWDYQWTFACWRQNGLSIAPAVNLVANIGAGADATHTHREHWFMNLPTAALTITTHPRAVAPLPAVDRLTFATVVTAPARPWWRDPARLAATLRSPWTYGALIRRLPLVGPAWARWRARAAGVGPASPTCPPKRNARRRRPRPGEHNRPMES